MPNDAELYRRIDEVVHFIWDPIGISDAPAARDEYRRYLPAIFQRVQAGSSDEIIEYMRWVVTDRMGLAFDEDRAEHAAKVMLDWKDYLSEVE